MSSSSSRWSSHGTSSTCFGYRILTVERANPTSSTGVASKNLPELVQYDGIPGAKYRPTDIHGHYRFTIGKAFVEQDGDHLLLAVPVGPHSLTRGIEVFDHGSLEGMSLNETQHCFTITVSI